MPRIHAGHRQSAMAPEHQHVFDQVMGVFGRMRGPFSMLLHSPKLAETLLPMVPFAREGTVVEPQAAPDRHPGGGARARRQLCLGRAGRRRRAASACASR